MRVHTGQVQTFSLIVLAALLVAAPAASDATRQDTAVRMSESSIRRLARDKPLPAYPVESVKRGDSGVAVASITSGQDGRVSDVTILQAPDDAIGGAVRAALQQWRISPTTAAGDTTLRGLRGKVTFYFRIVAGKGRVFHPEEMPGGPKPEPAAGPPPGSPGTSRPEASGSPPVNPPATASHQVSADLEIGEGGLGALQAASPPTVIDVRERNDFARQHRPGAINIPRDELAVRAYVELNRAATVVIDCSFTETRECQSAASTLLRGPRISRVFILIP